MPVDFLPLLLGVAFLGTLLVTTFIAAFVKRRGRMWLVGILVAAIFPAFYVWLYHRTEICYSRADDAGAGLGRGRQAGTGHVAGAAGWVGGAAGMGARGVFEAAAFGAGWQGIRSNRSGL